MVEGFSIRGGSASDGESFWVDRYMSYSPNKKYLFLTVVLIAGAFTCGFFYKDYLGNLTKEISSPVFKAFQLRAGEGQLTNPLLDCEVADGSIDSEFTNFRPKISEYLDKVIDNRNIATISVYFRHLNDGLWFGINEKEEFSPASLLKVPLMLSYYKMAESDPKILEKKILFPGKVFEDKFSQKINPPIELEEGKEYTIEELIERSIIYSDNQATYLLDKNLDLKIEDTIYNKFAIPDENLRAFDFSINIRDYARFFRILFNTSYLAREYSEKALDILSRVNFKDGLVAGVPGEIKVAHKFGERGNLADGVIQFHDCGIIYYPKHPYMLCVMTRGYDSQKLIETIANVSKITFEEVDKEAKNLDQSR